MTAVEYTCNLCRAACRTEEEDLGRETPSCPDCGSTVRMRAIGHLITTALFGTGLPLADLPYRPAIRAVGLTDAGQYAERLQAGIDYTNTSLHAEPRLDITAVPEDQAGRYDLVISSDVFEHVLPPVQRAFDGAAQLLRPGGHLVLTVPSLPTGSTFEHYPDAVDYEVVETTSGVFDVDIIESHGGRRRVSDPVFHGGPGSTLEMRVFSLPDVLRHLAAAGFTAARVLRGRVDDYGIRQDDGFSLPVLARL